MSIVFRALTKARVVHRTVPHMTGASPGLANTMTAGQGSLRTWSGGNQHQCGRDIFHIQTVQCRHHSSHENKADDTHSTERETTQRCNEKEEYEFAQPSWLVRNGPAIFSIVSLCVGYYIWTAVDSWTSHLKSDHDFKPVYDETGKLVGFTHPEMVNAVDKKRQLLDDADNVAASK